MFAPHQSLVNNAAMLGMRNPIQSLGYGQYNFPQITPALVSAAPTAPTAPTQPQLDFLGRPIGGQLGDPNG
jgi:hypothetical protein